MRTASRQAVDDAPVEQTEPSDARVQNRASGPDRRLRMVASRSARRPAVEEIAARDREIVELRAAGLTLAEIGREHGLSRERVRKIVAGSGGANQGRDVARARRVELRTARRARHARLARERSGEILARYREGVDPQRIARELGVYGEAVKALIKELRTDADRAARAAALGSGRAPKFPEGELLDGVRLVAEQLGRAPTGPEYAGAARELGLALLPTICMRFGGWRRALVAAGLEPAAGSGRVYAPRWHVAACWRALESVAEQLGDPPRYQRYAQLAAGREDLPSAATVRLRLGLWSAIAAALSARQSASDASDRDEVAA